MSKIPLITIPLILIFIMITEGSSAHAAMSPPTTGRYTLTYGPYMYHLNTAKDYNEYPAYTSLEWASPEQYTLGGAYFINSYDQPSGYLYVAKDWSQGEGDSRFYFKLTAGALLGYVGRAEHKIPVNWHGIGLGIIPAVGYQYQRVSTQVVILGISGVMFTVGYDFWP